MTEPPSGYLGAEARITRGPAPELVRAGYELELDDAALLHRGFGLADMAHVIALRPGTLPRTSSGKVRRFEVAALLRSGAFSEATAPMDVV